MNINQKFIINVFSILYFIIITVLLFVIYNISDYTDKSSDIEYWQFMGILAGTLYSPVFIIQIIKLIFQKFKWNMDICLAICGSIWLTIMAFVGLTIYAGMAFWDTTPTEPKIKDYKSELRKIKSQYENPEFDHFPQTLPNDIEDYYFYIENSFDGEDTHYLRFKINSEYVNNELKQKCINPIITRRELKNMDVIASNSPIYEGTSQYCLLHAKHDSGRYITGIATNDEHSLIYYFVKNY